MDNNDSDWDRWRGAIDTQMNTHAETIDSHSRRLDTLDTKVADILVKLAVPLFLISLVGVGLGGLIVALLTRQLK